MMSTPDVNTERIDEILTRFEWYKGKDESKWQNSMTKGDARAAIQQLVTAKMQEAVWTELSNLLKLPVTVVEYDDIGSQSCIRTSLILDRLAQLQNKEGTRTDG